MEKTNSKSVLVLGAIGSGKSTVLNIISSSVESNLSENEFRFVASN